MVPSTETTPVTRLTEHMTVYHPRVANYIITPTVTQEHIKYIPNSRKLLYDILQKPRNVMLPLNEYRQEYTAKYILHHDTIDDDFQKLIKLYTGLINKDDESSHNKLGLINELLFMYFNEFNYRSTLPTHKTPTKYQQYKVDTEKYEIVKFSRDINEKFRHMEEHFAELKEMLKYNPDTGFYTYDGIPILCRHVYMIYDNKSLQEMAAECYADGHCKYCGTSMMNYGDLLYDDVPLAVQSLLLSFTQSFENDIDSTYFKQGTYTSRQLRVKVEQLEDKIEQLGNVAIRSNQNRTITRKVSKLATMRTNDIEALGFELSQYQQKVSEYNLTLYINNEKHLVPCYNNKTIMQALMDGGVYIPSKCHNGSCGYCRSELVLGEVKIINDKRSSTDKKYNYIHPCSTYPLSDIEIIVR